LHSLFFKQGLTFMPGASLDPTPPIYPSHLAGMTGEHHQA
jgi:hypothetical protein